MSNKEEVAEDPVLVMLRHAHEDVTALVESGPFRVWVTETEEAGGILSEIVRCQRLLYELRSGRAVWLGQQADQEAAARLYEATPEGETLQLFEEPESGSPF